MKSLLKKYLLFTLFFCLPTIGFMIYIPCLIFIVWFFWAFIQTILKKEKKEFKYIFNHFTLFVSSLLFVGLFQYSIFKICEKDANNTLTLIQEFKKSHHRYPLKEEINIPKNIFSPIHYENIHDEKIEIPILYYVDYFLVFNSYQYDFKESKWEHRD